MTLSRSERETIVRYSDDPTEPCHFYTASPVQARRWRRLGYVLTAVRHLQGEPTGWEARPPRGSVTYRRLVNGTIKRRRATRPIRPVAKPAVEGQILTSETGGE